MKFEMPDSAHWLSTLSQFKGFDTDGETAAFLDVSKQRVSQWKHGKHEFDTATAWKLALALGVNPLFVIACGNWHSSPPEKRKKWELLAMPLEPKTLEAAQKRKNRTRTA
jgi:hypothetical protein